MERHDLWLEIAGQSGFPVPPGIIRNLDRYREWLIEEAIPGGGIGPEESERLDRRHIADSLLFSLVFPPNPGRVLDVGTGVGLPGIPLAVLLPDAAFTLLDRSGRRVDLARRAVRVLDLGNVEVVEGEVPGFDGSYPVVVSRATIPPDRFEQPLTDLLEPEGMGILGGSWADEPAYPGYVAKEIGSTFLDQKVWILIMRQK